ncbi:GLUG motif-containing protein [Thermophagus sp. OGC60D27]|uniref:GLUG motif-containing protein n=1 Tax=Thermophagus sp. OGC60D27 TaxID=3458415 RepID=UPI004037884A
MKRKLLLLFVWCLINAMFLGAQTATAPAGSGTENHPYQISNIENLYWLSQTETAWDAYFEQTTDIDASTTSTWDSGNGFSPIGNQTTQFSGHYNGKGYTIDGLTINRSSTHYIGLFGYTRTATIDSLGLTNVKVKGTSNVGALVGYNYYSTLRNSSSTGSVSGYDNVGGLVGWNLTGTAEYMITNCYSSCSVFGNKGVGGLAGYNSLSSTVNNSYSTGAVTGDDNVGGLVGYNALSSTINNCCFTGSVTGDCYIGGLVGYNNSSTVSNSYSTGAVTGNHSVGGLVGYNNTSSSVSTSYSTGAVFGIGIIGGLVGLNSSSSTINNCYYNYETSGQTSGVGSDHNSQTVTPLTTTAMKKSSTYILWDFTNTWKMVDDMTFPRLVHVSNLPVILPTLSSNTTVSETYIDTIQVVYMDNQDVSLELLSYPEGMTLTQDRIIHYSPTSWGNDMVEIRVTDGDGLSYIYSYNIQTIGLSGRGTESEPYHIGTLDDLHQLSGLPVLWDKYFIQTADIQASETSSWNDEAGFSPIGNLTQNFTGNYNGRGHTIDGLTMNHPFTQYIGLFGFTSGATIDSLGLTNVKIQGFYSVGSLVGYTDYSTLSNSYSTGSVAGVGNVGGLVGSNTSSNINNCYCTSSVSGVNDIGGLVGINQLLSTVNNCYSTGSVSGKSIVGGLVGYNIESEIRNSYATGSVSGENKMCGGLVGYNFNSEVNNGYAIGLVTGNKMTGGLVGSNSTSEINSSYFNSETSGQTSGMGDDNHHQTVTALTTNEMKDQSHFEEWSFTTDTAVWGIKANSTYPALLSIKNNAPFAFADTLNVAGNRSLLTNDYDYETAQEALTCKLISATTKGSIINGTYRFNPGTPIGTMDTVTYRVGELLASGDTLWGNYAVAILQKANNTAPVLTSVKEVTANEDTPLTLSLHDVTASDLENDALWLVISSRDNYTVNGTTITPGAGFVGTLTVPVAVSDGELISNWMDMTITVGQNVSIQPTEQNRTAINVYPNPVTTTLNVTGSTGVAYIYDLTGKMVLSRDLSLDNSINLSPLSKGIYLLSIDGECIKVVKE